MDNLPSKDSKSCVYLHVSRLKLLLWKIHSQSINTNNNLHRKEGPYMKVIFIDMYKWK